MLKSLRLEAVREILHLAEVYRVAARIAREDDSVTDIFERIYHGPECSELRALTAAIAGLSKSEQDELLALVWAGRSGLEFSKQLDVATARKVHHGIGEYLAAKPLPRYLRAGLTQLGYQVPD